MCSEPVEIDPEKLFNFSSSFSGMGCSSVISTGAVLLAVVIGGIIYSLNDIPQLPDIQVTYWGPGKGKPDDNKIRPFKIAIPDVVSSFYDHLISWKII